MKKKQSRRNLRQSLSLSADVDYQPRELTKEIARQINERPLGHVISASLVAPTILPAVVAPLETVDTAIVPLEDDLQLDPVHQVGRRLQSILHLQLHIAVLPIEQQIHRVHAALLILPTPMHFVGFCVSRLQSGTSLKQVSFAPRLLAKTIPGNFHEN